LAQFRASWRPEKANLPNLKKSLLSAQKAIFLSLIEQGFLGARTTVTQFLASWRPEKAIFPNLKEIAFFS